MCETSATLSGLISGQISSHFANCFRDNKTLIRLHQHFVPILSGAGEKPNAQEIHTSPPLSLNRWATPTHSGQQPHNIVKLAQLAIDISEHPMLLCRAGDSSVFKWTGISMKGVGIPGVLWAQKKWLSLKIWSVEKIIDWWYIAHVACVQESSTSRDYPLTIVSLWFDTRLVVTFCYFTVNIDWQIMNP